MAEIRTNQNATWVTGYVEHVSLHSGIDDDGWWMAKTVANPTTYRDVITRSVPYQSFIKQDASEEFLRIDVSTNRSAVTGDIVISRCDLNYFTRITPAVKEAHHHIGVLYKLVAAEGFMIVALAALLMAMRHARKSDLTAMLTAKAKAKK